MFESSLFASRRNAPPRRRALSFLAAFSLNVGVILTVLVVQAWNIEALPDPAERTAFYEVITVQMPESGGSPPPRPPAPEPTPPKPPPSEPVQPTVVEELEEVEEEPVVADTVPLDELLPTYDDIAGSGLPGSVGEGTGEGVLPGEGTGLGEGEGFGEGETLYEVGGDVTKPEKVYGPPPLYPESARRARLQGTVVVEAIIDRNGEVTDVRVLKGMPGGLDRAAIEAVSDWRFTPATRQGEPVPVVFRLTVQFSLT